MSINRGLTTEQIETRRSDLRRVTGFAITIPPKELFDATRRDEAPKMSMPGHQARFVIDLFNTQHERQVHPNNTYALLSSAIGESWMIMDRAIEHHPHEVSLEQAIAIGRHERTLRAMTVIASQSDRTGALIVENRHGSYYRITGDGDAIEVSQGVEPDSRSGCPEAGPAGQVAPTPLMRRFVPWATELAAYSLIPQE